MRYPIREMTGPKYSTFAGRLQRYGRAEPKPILAADEDFAQSAVKSGLTYPQLIERIIRLGLNSLRD